MSDTIPSDMVAVYDNTARQWWIYYISTDSQLTVIRGPKEGELEDARKNPPYDRIPIIVDDAPKPKAGNTQLGVCEYFDGTGEPQTRVYYLDARDKLVELGWNLKDKWFVGSLTTSEYQATPGSVIATAVTKDQLKVYYRAKDDPDQPARLWVAYVAINQEAWMRRPIMKF